MSELIEASALAVTQNASHSLLHLHSHNFFRFQRLMLAIFDYCVVDTELHVPAHDTSPRTPPLTLKY